MPPLSYDVTCYGDDMSSSSSSQHTTTSTGIASPSSSKPLTEQLVASASHSASATTTTTTTTTVTGKAPSPKKFQNKVSFFESVRVKKTLHINDYTQDEIDATWYNEMEVATIRFNTKLFVQEMESTKKKKKKNCCKLQHQHQQQQHEEDDEEEETETTARGLECRTKLGQKRKFTLRRMSQLIVLDEQYRQFVMDEIDPDYLALLYKQSCEQCVLEARQLGEQDERSASRC